MSYQVLARKWRPRNFDTLVGQEHVVRALTHALKTQRLHHAWLFTGTRGVGKTTLSRILAKSLNCEKGITDNPCGQCYMCTSIDQGKMTDYIELDAASNRGVDEMTQLLEQAVYAPTVGRYKVYMIDEVHMLTGHAFNAMLKTLEEPPEHVKFILATTDPQKIPVTVLSRCLQFNLKQMYPETIAEHLQSILAAEDVVAERPALTLLAKAANGSMRDALSLTDQAIAYSAGQLTTQLVEEMLGAIDQTYLLQLFVALVQKNSQSLWQIVQDMHARSISFAAALSDQAQWVAELAIMQQIPENFPADPAQASILRELTTVLSGSQLQLIYTMLVHSQSELAVAPDASSGFLMILLRIMSYIEPVTLTTTVPQGVPSIAQPTIQPTAPLVATPPVAASAQSSALPPVAEQVSMVEVPAVESAEAVVMPAVSQQPEPAMNTQPSLSHTTDEEPDFEFPDETNWTQVALQLPLKGMALELAKNTEWVELNDTDLVLRVSNKALAIAANVDRLRQAVQQYLGVDVGVKIVFAEEVSTTAHLSQQQQAQERQQSAQQAIQSNPLVQSIVQQFDGQIVDGSIRPTSS